MPTLMWSIGVPHASQVATFNVKVSRPYRKTDRPHVIASHPKWFNRMNRQQFTSIQHWFNQINNKSSRYEQSFVCYPCPLFNMAAASYVRLAPGILLWLGIYAAPLKQYHHLYLSLLHATVHYIVDVVTSPGIPMW